MAVPSDGPDISGILKRAIDGDVEAYGALYSIYLDRIYRYVFYQLGDRMMAEDVTEEVFVKAWKGIKSCRGKEETFSAWLYRIARNQAIDTIRRNHREVFLEGLDFTDDGDPTREVESVEEWQKVLDAVSDLPEAQKQIITLKFLNEADNNEIGRILGKRQGAVRALQMRALDSLRRRLDGGR
ncbi:MAG: sigma-70 family RNA polymerase sigma factor [Dehalococcoidales bacterium]|nr:sigma-70 family RNA polymerase sigma factor [Dehalococcoidales bacterium]